MRTQKTFTILLLLSFLFADVSESAFPNLIEDFFGFVSKVPPAELRDEFNPLAKLLPRKPRKAIYGHSHSFDFIKLYKSVQKYKKRFEKIQDELEFLDNALDFIDNLQSFSNSPLSQSNSSDKLESTDLLSRIKENFNLTGEPDLNTMKIITKPRCDFPDKINGTDTFTKITNKQLSIKRWWKNEKKNNLTYAFSYNVPVNVRSLFKATFNSWLKSCGWKFTETKSFKDSDILIAFVKVDGEGGAVESWDCIVG
ncbi:hypothetical protein TSUD_219860 [Trifolium subterraneum]|uniref:Uncharacterized protein n=1 Tax=Trifolium subterraneum TaxID=3900 RepID=A0A2Z6NCE6_TRISU|nr:hypothetical protein TSUD_219860 [Trifolium subterraneum]